MKIHFLATVLLFASFSTAFSQYDPRQGASQKFILHSELPTGYNIENTEIWTQQFNKVGYGIGKEKGTAGDPLDGENTATWQFNVSTPQWVNLLYIKDNGIVWYLAEPGDSISITFNGKSPVFKGPGAKGWELVYEIHRLNDSIDLLPLKKVLSKETAASPDLKDYFGWNDFLNFKASLILPFIEKYKPFLSKQCYENVKDFFIAFIESRRLWKFNYLRITTRLEERNQYGLTNIDLCNIYDSTMKGPLAEWLINKTEGVPSANYLWQILKLELYRHKKTFFKTSENIPSILGARPEDPYIKQYALAKQKFKGRKRARILAYPFYSVKGVFDAIGFSSPVDSLLNDFYAQQGYDDLKEAVKKMEGQFREKYARTHAPAFELEDNQGNLVSLKQLKRKMVILDFWFTGCVGCIQMTPALKKVEDFFNKDTTVVFVSISVDKDRDKWLNSIQQKKYTTGAGIQLYTEGKGNAHDVIKKYYVNSYPTLSIIDPGGKIITFNHYKVDPRKDGGKKLTDLILSQLAISKDGPYVYYDRPDSITTYNFNGGLPIIQIHNSKQEIKELIAVTDENRPFKINIQENMQSPPSVYQQPEKMLVLSDIEGEFAALKKLLINNNVIDDELNWTFGNGHLVFAGDMFDRGNHVTECLWLIYSLEKKAQANGGYVHFILGNHEIMNLQGDESYVAPKYLENAASLNKSMKLLYGPKSELGRWLRTKNIVEKIGDFIILHGGVSPQVNRMSLTLEQINETGRSCYGCTTVEMIDSTQKLLLSGPQSPIWYRGYYQGVRPIDLKQIDSTLEKFGGKHIITGHTIIQDTISVLLDGKIINTDTRHAEGKSEALLIIDDSLYRVNQEGKKTRILKIPKK